MTRQAKSAVAAKSKAEVAPLFKRDGYRLGQWITRQLAIGDEALMLRLLEVGDLGQVDPRLHPEDAQVVTEAARRTCLWAEAYSNRQMEKGCHCPTPSELAEALAKQLRRQQASTK